MEQSRISEFLKNARGNIKNPQLHNVYHIETFDRDGNRTHEAFGLNLLTNTGFQRFTTWYDRRSSWTNCFNIRFGTGHTNAPSVNDTALEAQVDAFNSTSNTAYKDKISTLYDSTSGNEKLIGIARVTEGYIEYNVSGITSDVDIYEIGLVHNLDTTALLTRSFIYDEHGQQTYITKELNQRLKVTVYMVSAISESVITSGYTNGKYIVGAPYGLIGLDNAYYGTAGILYMNDFYCMKRVYPTGSRNYASNHSMFPYSFTSGVTDGTVVMNASEKFIMSNKYDYISKSILEIPYDGSGGLGNIFGMGASGPLHCIEYENLSTPEQITAYDVFTDSYNSDSISKSFGQYHIDSTRTSSLTGRHSYDHIGIIPAVDFNMTSSYMYNHNTKEWDIADNITNAPSAWYGKDFTIVLDGITISSDPDVYGTAEQVYVYVNTKNTIPITSMALSTTRQLFATDKWWDRSTYVQISDPSNIPAALQTKKYYVTLVGNAGYIDDTRNQTTHQITCSEGTLYTPDAIPSTQTVQLNLSNYNLINAAIDGGNWATYDTTGSYSQRSVSFDENSFMYTQPYFEKYTTMNIEITTLSGKATKYWLIGYDNASTKAYTGSVAGTSGSDLDCTSFYFDWFNNIKLMIRYTDDSTIDPSDITGITMTFKNPISSSTYRSIWYIRKYGKVLRSNTNGWIALSDRIVYPNAGTPTAFMFRQSDSDNFVADSIGDIRFATDDRLIVINMAGHRVTKNGSTYPYVNSLRVFTVSSNVEAPTAKDVMLDFTDYDTDPNFICREMLWTWSQVSSNEAYVVCSDPWTDNAAFAETCVLQVYNEDGNGVPQQVKLTNTMHGQIMTGTKYVIGIVPDSSPLQFVVYDASDGTLYDSFEIPSGYTWKDLSLRAGAGCAYFTGYIGSDYTTFVYQPQTKSVTNINAYYRGLELREFSSRGNYDMYMVLVTLNMNGCVSSSNNTYSVLYNTITDNEVTITGTYITRSGWTDYHYPAYISTSTNPASMSYLFKGDDFRTNNSPVNNGLCASDFGFGNGQIVTSKNGKHKLLVASNVRTPVDGDVSSIMPCVIDIGASLDETYKWAYWPWAGGRYPQDDSTIRGLTEFDNNIIIYNKDGSVIYKSLGRFIPHKVTGTTTTINAYNNPKYIGNKTITVKLDPYTT